MRDNVLATLLLFVAIALSAQETPITVDPCTLYKNAAQYDHKLVKVSGEVGIAFEAFSIYTPSCDVQYSGVWLIFGGDVPTPTKSTMNDNTRPGGKDIKVENIPIPIVKDAVFEDFHKRLTTPRILNDDGSPCKSNCSSHQLSATLIGRFFAGNLKGVPRGYGHLGCCSLLAIQQVIEVKTLPQTSSSSRNRQASGSRPKDAMKIARHEMPGTVEQTTQSRRDD